MEPLGDSITQKHQPVFSEHNERPKAAGSPYASEQSMDLLPLLLSQSRQRRAKQKTSVRHKRGPSHVIDIIDSRISDSKDLVVECECLTASRRIEELLELVLNPNTQSQYKRVHNRQLSILLIAERHSRFDASFNRRLILETKSTFPHL